MKRDVVVRVWSIANVGFRVDKIAVGLNNSCRKKFYRMLTVLVGVKALNRVCFIQTRYRLSFLTEQNKMIFIKENDYQ